MSYGQNKIKINATLNPETDEIQISQNIIYQNTTQDTLKTIYLNDWSNSFSTKKTPLAVRFSEEYNTDFHFAKSEERGYTVITSAKDNTNNELSFEHLAAHPDVLKIDLVTSLAPKASYNINLNYIVKVPSDKFTRYGVTSLKDYHLKYWYITPAIYNDRWHYSSNKNLDDLYIPKSDIELTLEYPKDYQVISELNIVKETNLDSSNLITLQGSERIDSKLFLVKHKSFNTVETQYFSIISDVQEEELSNVHNALITDRITHFITKYLGQYPHEKLVVSTIDVKKDPIYGLNQLPEFIRPFPKNFHYELKILKNTIGNYLDNTLLINPRKDQWLKDGIQIYFLIKYIEDNYPDMKLLGSLADIWGIRSFHAADLNFNEQYGFLYMHMARTNRDQPLNMAKDSLLKFNKNLASKFKAGVGFKYLDDFINANILEESLKTFLSTRQLKPVSSKDFENFIKGQTNKDIDWFFEDYIKTRKKIDFKIKDVEKTDDSIYFTVKNLRNNKMPISLFTLRNDSVLSKSWIENVTSSKRFSIPKDGIDKLVFNYDRTIPEYNLRNNWKSLKGWLFNNKPLQVRLFKDFEDPNYNQLFIMPKVEFRNIYDGLLLGGKFYNATVLRKGFNYRISPAYGTKSRELTGSASAFFIKNIENRDLFQIVYGFTGSYSSYAPGLFARKLNPYLNFGFRNKDDFRSNEVKSLRLRYIDIDKDPDVNNISGNTEPDYGVFNVQFVNSNAGLINYNRWSTDFQLSEKFGKISLNYEYRKLFESNRQFNIRLYAGTFLYNKNPDDLNYFSFALDRPTDYLFDYNYLGRSEQSGIYSQQLIIAEGGFKSQLETPFANQWMTTMNLSTTLWKYIQAYGDIGLVKSKNTNAKFVYDSGIRLNLVTDYFEVYFPLYSNLGWEVGQENYDQKIRFLFTVDPQTLLGLFRRKWY